MGQPLSLRPDYDAAALRALARRAKDVAQARRLPALGVDLRWPLAKRGRTDQE
jgi:hypothetical protein